MSGTARLIIVFATFLVALNAASEVAPVATKALDVPAGRYALDTGHGYITFSYSHMGFSNPHVGFTRFDVALDLDPTAPQKSQLQVSIDPASVDTRVSEFDKHLRGSDYFDVASHPQITFESTAIEMTSPSTATISGNLTIKGISKPVTLAAVLNKAAVHPLQRVPTLGVSATGTLKRSDWGLGKYVPVVSDEVDLRIEVELPQVVDKG